MTQLHTLQEISTQLKEQTKYGHPLYQSAWDISNELTKLYRQISKWQTTLKTDQDLIIYQLSRSPSTQYILDNSQLSNYNRFFSKSNTNQTNRIIRGLSALEAIVDQQGIQQIKDWKASSYFLSQSLLELQIQYEYLKDQKLEQRGLATYLAYQTLERAIDTEINWWGKHKAATDPSLVALQFLKKSLTEDDSIANQYQDLKFKLFNVISKSEKLINCVPLLEERLRDTYWPLLQENLTSLREQQDSTIIAAKIQEDARQFHQSFQGFRQLFEVKQQQPESMIDAYYKDSLTNYLPSLRSMESEQVIAFDNPYVPILDSLIRFSQLKDAKQRRQHSQLDAVLADIETGLLETTVLNDTLNNRIRRLPNELLPDKTLLKNSEQIRKVTQIFAVGNHLLQSFRNAATQDSTYQKWISIKALSKKFQQDSLSQSLFFGLLYESVRNTPELAGNPYKADQVANLSISLLKGIEEIQRLEASRKQLELTGKSLPLQDYSTLVLQTVNIVQQSFHLLNSNKSNNTLTSSEQILLQSTQLYQNLIDTQYHAGIGNLAALLQSVATAQSNKSQQRATDNFKNNLLTYGSFMAAVALAKTSDQVKTALELASVETGSSRVKRNNNWNIALNAYLGLGGGYEEQEHTRSGFQLNLATPIGLSISRRLKEGHSLSLFGSILDLGPVVNYDFNNQSTYTDVDLKFENFVAPGAFLFWNIARSPFTTGIGVQRTAKIRQIDNGAQQATRFMGTFLIDIPIFNLFTQKP